MALATDMGGIQFRTLNSSKGPAVRATRAQADRVRYKAAIRHMLENQDNLLLFQQAVDDLLLDGDRVAGVITQAGITFRARSVVLTAGTFLSGKIHIGLENYTGGRAGDPAALTLGARLRELALPVGRLKTGTPPRLDGRTIRFDQLDVQPGDDPRPVFSVRGSREMHPRQLPCWITHTNTQTHDIIRSDQGEVAELHARPDLPEQVPDHRRSAEPHAARRGRTAHAVELPVWQPGLAAELPGGPT